jgi:hypothetical protein
MVRRRIEDPVEAPEVRHEPRVEKIRAERMHDVDGNVEQRMHAEDGERQPKRIAEERSHGAHS